MTGVVVSDLRVLAAATPADVYRQMLHLLRLAAPRLHGADPSSPFRLLLAVEAIQLALMWRVARQAFGMADYDRR